MRLSDLQALLVDAVREDAPLPGDHPAGTLATGSARLSPAQQVDVYREQFFFRHLASLREDFPTLVHLLGGAAFDEAMRAYLRAHPPSAFSMRDMAAEVGPFLERAKPWQDDPLLAECARVEWAFIEAFDAPDAPPFDASVLANASEDDLPNALVTLHPAVRLLALAHPTHDFRVAVRRGESPARPAPVAGGGRVHVVVFRTGETVRYVEVEPGAFDVLSRLARGETLGAACEAAGATEEQLGVWFQHWTQYGLLAKITVSASASRPDGS